MNWLQKFAVFRLPFFSSCVDWPEQYNLALDFIAHGGENISREEFLRNVEFEGSADEVIPAWDYHIQYEKLPQRSVFWFVHSAIEHVFADERDIAELQLLVENGELQ